MAGVQRLLRGVGVGKQEKTGGEGGVTSLPGHAGQVKETHLYPKRESVGILSREKTL